MIPIRRERVPWEIWKTFTVSKGRRYERWAFTHPGTRRRVTFKTEALAKKARAEAHRGVRESELRLVGRAQERFTRFGRLCFTFQIDEDRALDLLEQTLASRRQTPTATVPELVEGLKTALQREHKSPDYQANIRNRLAKFAQAFPGPLIEISPAAAENYLDACKVELRTRNNYAAAISRLVSYAKETSKIPDTWSLPLKPAELPEREPATFNPAQLRLILEHVSDTALPAAVLGAFAGLRPIETLRITWEQIDWEDGIIIAPKAKKMRGRRIPFAPNLRPWLEPLRGDGRIVPITFSGLNQAMARAVRKANQHRLERGLKDPIRWDKDILRHSFGSHRWAVTRNKLQVVEEMGNSVRVFDKHYGRILPKAEGTAWFNIQPGVRRSNVVPLREKWIDWSKRHSEPANGMAFEEVLSPPQQRRNHT